MTGAEKSECPCKGCPDRKVGCHGECPKYGKWSAEMAWIRSERTRIKSEEFLVKRLRDGRRRK